MSSWVKLHRSINQNQFLMSDQTAFVLFIKLLTFVDKNGSCRIGRYKMELLTGIKGITAYKALNRLKNEGMVTTSVTGRYTLINISNWHKYQGNGNRSSNSSVTAEEQLGNSSVTLNKNKNKKKNIYIVPKYLEKSFNEYKAMRKDMRKPLTETATKRLILRLENLYPNNHDMQIKCLENATDRNWLSVYPLKENEETSVIARLMNERNN